MCHGSSGTSAAEAGWCLWMKYHEVAEPIEVSSLYNDAPLFSLGFGVQFNVGDFLRPVYA